MKAVPPPSPLDWQSPSGCSPSAPVRHGLPNGRTALDGWTEDAPPSAAGEHRRRSWQPVDLDDVLLGRYERPAASVGRRDDRAGLLYPGRTNSAASETEGGKTWLALTVVATELRAGNGAAYLDFEDDEGGVVGRLMALDVDLTVIRDRFAYFRPEESIAALGNRDDLAEALGDLRPTVVVLDGVTEAMTLHGLEVKDNADVARFGRMLPGWIAGQGPAVLSLDHVTKDRETRGRYALGGAHKLNALNGAAYVLENRTPFGIGTTGRSTLFIAKDRPGQLRRNALPASGGMHWYGDLVLDSHHEQFVEASITPPTSHGEDFRPTVLMRRVSDALGRAGHPLSGREITDRVSGKQQVVRQALALLVDEGFVSVKPGPSNSRLHRLARPFEEASQ